MERSRTKILIADDGKEARQELRVLLELDSDFEIVAEADSGAKAIDVAKKVRPDILLVDRKLHDMDGVLTAAEIKREVPSLKFIVQSDSNDAIDFFYAIKYGAQGYLLKRMHPASRHEYIRSIVVDDASMSRELAYQILTQLTEENPPRPAQPSLTAVELELLRFLCIGYKNGEIADELLLSENAVKGLLKDLLFKLRLKNRIQLVRYAYEKGMFTPGAYKPRS